jgi:creatinine amidohydrolase/Fe(II)-dependent formamide hydrolase-like protein
VGFYLGELAWPDVEEFLRKHDVVVVPVGSCEQHGPHLPLDTDAYAGLLWCFFASCGFSGDGDA